MVGAPLNKKCAFTKAASIHARRQSENSGLRQFGFVFRRCPLLEHFFQFSSSALKRQNYCEAPVTHKPKKENDIEKEFSSQISKICTP